MWGQEISTLWVSGRGAEGGLRVALGTLWVDMCSLWPPHGWPDLCLWGGRSGVYRGPGRGRRHAVGVAQRFGASFAQDRKPAAGRVVDLGQGGCRAAARKALGRSGEAFAQG